jgi:hypothetical protein
VIKRADAEQVVSTLSGIVKEFLMTD